MSYGTEAPVLDSEGFHVVCLSGNNGQGKSALLDALTWALWGRARKTVGCLNPAPDLLRTSEREMSVEFEFDVEGDRYRVLRTYTETGRGGEDTPRAARPFSRGQGVPGAFRSEPPGDGRAHHPGHRP